MPKPIKRHKSIQPISREHHHGLLLGWKIREGIKKEIPLERIKSYANWFWETHLILHFDLEEKHLFPILGAEHEMVVQAVKEHRRLKELFENQADLPTNLSLIEKELTDHIRFEERTLFNEIQTIGTEEQLEAVEKAHSKIEDEGWEDEFWV